MKPLLSQKEVAMRTILAFLCTLLVLTAGTITAIAQSSDEGQASEQQRTTITVNPDSHFAIYGRLQTVGFMQSLNDQFSDKTRLYLFLKQARFGVNGVYEEVKFDFQVAFGGEEEIKAPSPGVSLSLLDLNADIPVGSDYFVKVGQFKIPYSREALTNGGYVHFNERSIQHGGFKIGRDVGVALHGKSGNFATAIGVFTGGGRNVPIRYIPEKLGFPLVVLRTGVTTLDEEDFNLKQNNYLPSGSGSAFFINALYTKDTKLGHSTALNVKLGDKSILLSTAWNPFIGRAPLVKGTFWQAGADAMYKTALSEELSLNAEAEVNIGSYKNEYGKVSLSGGRAQMSLRTFPFDFGIRYAVLFPDEKFAYRVSTTGISYQIVDKKPMHELTLGASYALRKERLKLSLDFPLQFNTPVITESNIGAYVLTQQPDQTSFVAAPTNAKVNRETVLEARLQLQFIF